MGVSGGDVPGLHVSVKEKPAGGRPAHPAAAAAAAGWGAEPGR